MKKNDVLESINYKLTPDSRAERELFERAAELKAGEKYIGDTEEIFLSKGIMPESYEQAEPSPARVRSTKLTIAAAAAVLVLFVGAAALFDITSHRGVETDSTPAVQKTEESKTEIKSYTEVESDKPWDIIGQLIKNCYEEYDHMGGDYKSLPELKSFQELTSYSDLRIYITDMYQNGEIEDKYVFIAENACNYEYHREKSDINNGLLKSETNPLRYFKYIDEEYDISKNLSDYYPEDYEYETIKQFKRLIEKLEGYGDGYKDKSEYSQLLKYGREYGGFAEHITAMYIKGDVSDKGLEIAFEAAKEICVKADNSDKVLHPESDIVALMTTEHYSKEMTETPKQRLVKDEDVNLWVKLKLQRIGSKLDGGYTTTGETYDMKQDVNYISLVNCGSCTAQRAIADLYDSDELDGHGSASKAARQVIFDLGRNIGGDDAQNGDDVLKDIIGQAELNGICFDFVRGVCDGNYRESGDYLKKRDGADELFAALAKLPSGYNVTNKDITPVGHDYEVEQKLNAYAYLDLYDCYVPENMSGQGGDVTLHIIIPDKKVNSVIVDGVEYKNLDKELFEQFIYAVQEIVPPYGEKQEIKKYDNVTLYPAPKNGVKATYTSCGDYAEKLYALAGYISDNYLGCNVGENPTELKENTVTAELYDKDKKVCDVYIPDKYSPVGNEGTIYVNGVMYKGVDLNMISTICSYTEFEAELHAEDSK